MTTTLSKTISILRTVLCFQIVLLHTATTGLTSQEISASYNGPLVIYKYVSVFFTLITKTSVPLFFIISGYLFFIKYNNTVANYENNIKSRSRHLLQPIMIWTTIYLLFYYIAQQVPYTASLFSGNNLPIADYGWKDFIGAYSGIFNNGIMFAGQFWFLRNLFIICLFTPLLWYLFKYTKKYSLYVIGITWFFHEQLMINTFTIDTIFFFTLGAWIAFNNYNIDKFLNLKAKWFYPIFFIALIATIILPQNTYHHFFYLSCIFFGTICISHICYTLIKKGKGDFLVRLSAGSYFCFLLHQQIQMFVKRALHKLLKPDSDLTMLLLYFLVPCLIIAICYILYNYLDKYHPTLLAILTGTKKSISKTISHG
ncbi:acyltransferase family protein [Parabacteroides goldsteinii]|nr:acyltransferase [Parabacteroides goldsteinii]